MSNYDPNTAVSRAIGIDLTTVDVGLRAYMLRIHNHMAAGVGLSNLGAWLTYQFTGPELLPNPADVGVQTRPAYWLGDFYHQATPQRQCRRSPRCPMSQKLTRLRGTITSK